LAALSFVSLGQAQGPTLWQKPWYLQKGWHDKYEIILYWSDEDGAFIAEVPELAGCAADGATRQEALTHAEVSVCRALG
jgi:hypothetical protein